MSEKLTKPNLGAPANLSILGCHVPSAVHSKLLERLRAGKCLKALLKF